MLVCLYSHWKKGLAVFLSGKVFQNDRRVFVSIARGIKKKGTTASRLTHTFTIKNPFWHLPEGVGTTLN